MGTDDNAEDLFPRDELRVREPSKARKLESWHKPRKQWVRSEQWAVLIERLLGDLLLDGRPFRYLTLPGKHLLDVRILHDVCKARDLKLRFLGFDCSLSELEAGLSMEEVRQLSHVHELSRLWSDRFERIASRQTLAYKRTRAFGGFDAVNLDLCDSVASREPGARDSTLAAIKSLVELQSNTRQEPWVLFITTRVDPELVHRDVLNTFIKIIQKNMNKHFSFRDEVANRDAFAGKELVADGKGLNGMSFVRTFGIGIAKWMLQFSLSDWNVTMTKNSYYRVRSWNQWPDMLSLAFRFAPKDRRLTDPTGITPNMIQARTREEREEKQARAFVPKICNSVDVDQLLHEDETLWERIVEENARLLKMARFEYSEALTWGRESRWTPDAKARRR